VPFEVLVVLIILHHEGRQDDAADHVVGKDDVCTLYGGPDSL
jgi:hypothetical protein